jgi:capsular polysaccharide biosynthesis protein
MSHPYFENNHNFVVEILQALYPNAHIHNCSTPSPGMYMVPIHSLHDFHHDKAKYHSAYRYLRSICMPHVEHHPTIGKYSTKLYISRADSKYRRVVNEPELMEYLAPLGFQKVTLTGIPLFEQMAMFYHADVIITLHGAALTNTLFCKQNTRIIELGSSYLAGKQHFSDIAECFGYQHSRYVHSTIVPNHDCMANDILLHTIPSIYP